MTYSSPRGRRTGRGLRPFRPRPQHRRATPTTCRRTAWRRGGWLRQGIRSSAASEAANAESIYHRPVEPGEHRRAARWADRAGDRRSRPHRGRHGSNECRRQGRRPSTPRNFQGPPPSITSASAGTPPDEVPALASPARYAARQPRGKSSGEPLSSCCRSWRLTPSLRSSSAPRMCPGIPEQAAGAPRGPTRGNYSTWRRLTGSTRTSRPGWDFPCSAPQ